MAKARSITTEIGGKLHIESQQDEHRSKQSQFGLNSKVEFGIGSSWEFSGNANAEGGNSHSKQVKEQSGLFAEERYSVEADSITLVGGAIASNTPGNSTICTNNIAFSDIENSSDYSAASGSINGGYSQGGGVSGGTGVPMYDGGDDKTLTKATITNGTIILNKDTNPTETTAEALGINTDLSQANKQVEAPKEVGKLLGEQKSVQEAAGHISKAAETYIARQQKEILKQEADTRKEAEEAAKAGDYQTAQRKQREADALEKEAKRWSIGGDKKRQVTAITTAINFALAGKPAEAIAAGAASPYVNEVIKKLTDSEAFKSLNIPAHILWGAAESYLTGGSAETGAIAAGVGEIGAITLSHLLYGKSPKELNSQEKANLLNGIKLLSGAAVAAYGTASGNSIAETTANIGQGMTVAENAVENNAITPETVWDAANIAIGVSSLSYNISEGNYGSAAIDAAGLLYDGMATAFPFLPAGASAGIDAYRASNTIKQSIDIGNDVAKATNAAHKAAKNPNNIVNNPAVTGTKVHRATGDILGEGYGQATKLSDSASSYFRGANRTTGRQPDMSWSGTRMWADLTTPNQWNAHLRKYQSQYGEGIPILYKPHVGVVNSYKLHSGASVILNGGEAGYNILIKDSEEK